MSDLPKLADVVADIQRVRRELDIGPDQLTVTKYSRRGGKYDGRMLRRLGGFDTIVDTYISAAGDTIQQPLPSKQPVVVILDIETAPLESFHWKLWDETIGLEQIKNEWSILSFSAKKLGDNKVMYRDTSGRGPSKVGDDSELLKELWTLLDEADIVVVQNGKEFDIKKINARMLMAGMKPYSPIRVIDTYIVARKHFGFTSNKLAWMSQHLTETKKSEHKKFPGFKLWVECLKDNPEAWAEMMEYNCLDVVATEQLYLKMRPWIEGHPNMALYSTSTDIQCPKCGSEDIEEHGTSRAQVSQYPRYYCNSCQGWSRGRKSTSSKTKRDSLLSN